MQVATLEPDNIDQAHEVTQQAAAVLNDGGLVVFPTETVYGVGAAATSDHGVRSLRELKASGAPQTFAVHLPHADAAERYVDSSLPTVQRLVSRLFPGPVTLTIEVDEDQIAQRMRALEMTADMRDRVYRDRRVGLRCPDHDLTRRVFGQVHGPVIASGANLPGRRRPATAREAIDAIDGRADFVIDGGRSRYGKPSTMVMVRPLAGGGAAWSVDREGVYDERTVRKLMRWTILLVCSGNTCRSPMAEGIARQLLAERRGIAPDELDAAGIVVKSAGAFAMPGSAASPEAVEALAKQNIDISRHRSQPLTPELIRDADVIYGMTEAHRQAVVDLVPDAADKTFRLDSNNDVSDPIGGDATTYQRTAELIRRRLTQRLKEQQP